MKSEIVISSSIKETKFPLIAESIISKTVVLFVSKKEGTVLVQGNGSNVVGEFYDGFPSCTLANIWKILNQVTITFKS
jgi:hypothetical protein